jgi:hypothetical protein
MLTRSGAQPGPAGISYLRHSLAEACAGRKVIMPYLGFLDSLSAGDAPAEALHHCGFFRGWRIPHGAGGLPLRPYHPEAHRVIAAGACGPVFLALGGVAAEAVISVGAVSAVSLAIGAMAPGWRGVRCARG